MLSHIVVSFVICLLFGFVKTKEVTCPCGSTGFNFTTSTSTESKRISFCSQFQFCAKCSINYNKCESCPSNRSGPFCTEEQPTENSTLSFHSRYKRFTRCPNIFGPKLGSINCWYGPRESHCTGTCLPGHAFPDQLVKEITLQCINGRWSPRNSFPACYSQGHCALQMNGAGNYNCTTGIHGTHCDVRCIGHPRSSGRYGCFPGRGWEQPLPQCVKQKGTNIPTVTTNCADPGQVTDAVRFENSAYNNGARRNGFDVGCKLTYRCRNGYRAIGNTVLQCLPSGQWSNSPPVCRVIDTTTTTRRTTTTTTVQPQERTSTCRDPGFVKDGERFNTDATPSNIRRRFFQEGTPLVFSCKNGFALHGDSIIRCLPSGSWSNNLPQCKSVTPTTTTRKPTAATTTKAPSLCKIPIEVMNGEKSIISDGPDKHRPLSGNAYEEVISGGTRVQYTCNDGYQLEGRPIVTCLNNGILSTKIPKCLEEVETSCKIPLKVTNGRNAIAYPINERRRRPPGDISVEKISVGIEVHYMCNKGYILEGSDTITCLENGILSSDIPTCIGEEETSCKIPTQVSNGQNTIVYPINARRRLPPGNVQEEDISVGIGVHYVCNEGYILDGSDTVTCLENGALSSDIPKCIEDIVEASYCKIPKKVANSKRTIAYPINERRRPESVDSEDLVPEGARVHYLCDEGYFFQGKNNILCERNGIWSSGFPDCIEDYEDGYSYCKDPGVDPNGKRSVSPFIDARNLNSNHEEDMFVQGEELVFSCNEGYKLEGEETLICLYTGEWSNLRPTCHPITFSALRAKRNVMTELYCDDPGYVANSRRLVVKYPDLEGSEYNDDDDDIFFPAGMVLQYVCHDGLDLVGQSNITCLSNGSWNGNLPECHAGCGINFISSTNRITNGRMTTSGDWPWQVAIASVQRNNFAQVFCGGALVDANTVITAAHCLTGKRIHRTRLYFGKYYFDTFKDDDKVEVRRPTKFIMHPQYNGNTFDNDIAIIHFLPEIRMTERIHAICLPDRQTTSRNLVSGNQGYVTGWGMTELGRHPDSLMMAQVPVVSAQNCDKTYKQAYQVSPITNNMFCAGYQEGKIDSCSGDSGGPVSFLDPQTKRFVLEGLVSFGPEQGCGLPNLFGVYTKVSNMLRWIKSKM